MRAAAILTFLGLLGGAFLDLRGACRPEPPPLARADLQAALQALEAERAPEDVVVHSPLFHPSLLSTFGDVGASPTPARGRRQWVVDDGRQPMFVRGRELRRTRFGDVHLRLVDAPRDEGGPEYDLRRDLRPDTLRVEDLRGGILARCQTPRSPDGFACPGQPEWIYAAPVELIVEGEARSCVWAHPKAGATLVFELPGPPGPRRLSFGAGLSDGATEMAGGAPVDVEIRQDRALTKLRVANRKGWNERTVELQAGRSVEVRIQTRHDGMRHLCIDAQIDVAPEEAGS